MDPDGEHVNATVSMVQLKFDNYRRYILQPSIVSVTITGSKEFQNSYSSTCHFALVIQLDKEGKSTCPDQFFLVRTSGRVDSLDSE